MIDLHLLYHPAATRPDWWAACLNSAVAAERRGCTVYVVEDPGSHVGAARARARVAPPLLQHLLTQVTRHADAD